ncbi:MAG: hypothetical protein K8R69_00765 [Deltaproteobacteria bacterium]|nr:hypothetical protein [Deltaproteobacteria bacterium]
MLADMGGQAVLDKETGLVWERRPRSKVLGAPNTQIGALDYCYTLTLGGKQPRRTIL